MAASPQQARGSDSGFCDSFNRPAGEIGNGWIVYEGESTSCWTLSLERLAAVDPNNSWQCEIARPFGPSQIQHMSFSFEAAPGGSMPNAGLALQQGFNSSGLRAPVRVMFNRGTGDETVYVYSDGNAVSTGFALTRGVEYSFQVSIDWATRTYDVFVDGSPIASSILMGTAVEYFDHIELYTEGQGSGTYYWDDLLLDCGADQSDDASLSGYVLAAEGCGQVIGGVDGALVRIEEGPFTFTGTDGSYRFDGLGAGPRLTTVSKAGYLPVEKVVSLAPSSAISEVFVLQNDGGVRPQVIDSTSKRGRHVIEGMPGMNEFEAVIRWNGEPGTVRFRVAGVWHTASVVSVDEGQSLARLSLSSVGPVAAASEWLIEAVNGEGRRETACTGVFFYPVPAAVRSLLQVAGSLSWEVSSPTKLTIEVEPEAILWEVEAGVVKSSASYSGLTSVQYDASAGVFQGTAQLSGSIELDVEVSGVEVLGEGALGAGGKLSVGHRGTDGPSYGGQIGVELNGKAGVGVPAVKFIEAAFPLVAGALAPIRVVPIFEELLTALRLRLYNTIAGAVSGHWTGPGGDCWFGANSYSYSALQGLEAHALVEFGKAELGVYIGGEGGPSLEVCPELRFQGVTVRGFLGAYASYWIWDIMVEKGYELTFGATRRQDLVRTFPIRGSAPRWVPLSHRLSRYGPSGRWKSKRELTMGSLGSFARTGGTVEEILIENVSGLAHPHILLEESGPVVRFALHDLEKPWHAATDVGQVVFDSDLWAFVRVTDDLLAEFAPSATDAGSSVTLVSWNRAAGDLSQTIGPEDVLPQLEIVASTYDRQTGLWSIPVQLTANMQTDRDPLSVAFGTRAGVVWVQNEGAEAPGNAAEGDRLMFAELSESGWQEPVVLWTGDGGIINADFACDGGGEGALLFNVDVDGDLSTREDRELYSIATESGVWQSAVRMTDDSREDSLPTVVAPLGVATAVWKTSDTLFYSPLSSWNPRNVFSTHTTSDDAATLEGVSMPGGAAVAYTLQTEDGSDIVASFYDATLDLWSLPRQLTADPHAESSLSLAVSDGALHAAYVKTVTERSEIEVEIDGQMHTISNVPRPGRADLAYLRHVLGVDLAVTSGSLTTAPLNPPPGSNATIRATIGNWGDLPAGDFDVSFYQGDEFAEAELIGSLTVAEPILAGTTIDLEMDLLVPIGSSPLSVFAVVDPDLEAEDRDRSNNVAAARAVLPDLAAETGTSDPLSSTLILVRATVSNLGPIPSPGFTVSFHLGSASGPLIGTASNVGLESGATLDAALVWDIADLVEDDATVIVYAVVDSEETVVEWSEQNNTQPISVQIDFTELGALPEFDEAWRIE